ncbi:mechanosensitive ion channel family protein [bacterium]|nr:mechanosensitive ion channel family protein [bacterium]
MTEDFYLQYLNSDMTFKLFKVCLVLIGGYLVAKISMLIIATIFSDQKDKQRSFVAQKLIKYALFIATLLVILKIFGVDLKVILATAGVLSLAVGFAAQTSVSNLISGLFMIFEKPFVVGDIIEVSGVKGEVLSVDLLSMRIKTVDNLLIRVPNEVVMKAQVTNYSYFPIRRHDMTFSLSYTEDLEKVKKILLELVENNPYCLDEPEPLFIVEKMGEYFMDVKFGVWGESDLILHLQSSFREQVREAFIKNKVIFPQRTLRIDGYNPKGDAPSH